MMDLGTIRQMSRQAARDAKRAGKAPWSPTKGQREILATGVFPAGMRLPMLGDFVPTGWQQTGDALFVDTSGFGNSGEAALTQEAFAKAIAGDADGTAYAQTEQGQFQGYVARYIRKLAKARVAVPRKRESVAA